MTISFIPMIASFQELRHIFAREGKSHYAEYCYHMVSVIMETDKILNDEGFSADYVEEHCNYMARYAKEIAREQPHRDYDIQ